MLKLPERSKQYIRISCSTERHFLQYDFMQNLIQIKVKYSIFLSVFHYLDLLKQFVNHHWKLKVDYAVALSIVMGYTMINIMLGLISFSMNSYLSSLGKPFFAAMDLS